MRDSHRIREQSAFHEVVAALVRGARTLALVALAFAAGRMTAPKSEGPRPPPPVAEMSAEVAAPAPAPLVAPAPPAQAPVRARDTAKERRPKVLVASGDPQALADGLLPEQVGTARAGEYSVQLASFASRQEARAFCQQLARRGFHPHVAETRPSSQPHRVRLGRFSRRDLAQSYRGRLAQADITASVVQVD